MIRAFSTSLSVLTVITVMATTALAGQLTVFSDGSLLELTGTAQKGLVEVTMPTQIRQGSLRVIPSPGTTIGQVDLVPCRMPLRQQKELDALTEQELRLKDRLQALDTRESIFTAAARAQSSRPPRKSKTNPDPVASVRQGTDFAIAQLEAVYTARRRTGQELERLTARIARLRETAPHGPTVRIRVTPARGQVTVAALLEGGGWQPRYELRLDGAGNARLTQQALFTRIPAGCSVRFAPGPIKDGLPRQTIPLRPGEPTTIASWRLPVSTAVITPEPLTSFAVTLSNGTGTTLPAGEVAVYFTGTFLGTTTLPAAPDATLIRLGNPSSVTEPATPHHTKRPRSRRP